MAKFLGMATLALALAGCAGSSPVRLGPDADVRTARAQLAQAAGAGPVRLEINGLPRTVEGTLDRAEIERQAARGITGLSVRFGEPPAAVGSVRLILLFDPPTAVRPEAACMLDRLPAPAPQSDATRLHAVFCQGGTFVADALAPTPSRTASEVQRLIWRTTGRLFPDDYSETYGFDLFGRRVGVEGQAGF